MDNDDSPLVLTDYERDNLVAALLATSGHAGRSPMLAANTGDWLMQVLWKLGWTEDRTHDGTPNHDAEKIVEQAKWWAKVLGDE